MATPRFHAALWHPVFITVLPRTLLSGNLVN